uniref:Uncharacterized protein n=1 Tax=Oryza sativa subsp. japonica TaxID=39947 RepID=Q69VD7_ORYSJ|nr:hypothetical protein [Oryza sativa Japonica Group]
MEGGVRTTGPHACTFRGSDIRIRLLMARAFIMARGFIIRQQLLMGVVDGFARLRHHLLIVAGLRLQIQKQGWQSAHAELQLLLHLMSWGEHTKKHAVGTI